jgi:hypothetical protein
LGHGNRIYRKHAYKVFRIIPSVSGRCNPWRVVLFFIEMPSQKKIQIYIMRNQNEVRWQFLLKTP